MKLWNNLCKTEVFNFGSAGRLLYCKFGQNMGKNIDSIVLPYDYDKDYVKEKFEIYKIKINIDKMWDTLISSGCERVMEVAKRMK